MKRAASGRRFDVLILGGGIAGASMAARLAGARRVALLEREPHLAYHATGRSAAMFMPSYGGAAVRPLTAASAAFIRAPPEGFGGSLLTPRPVLHIAARGQLGRLEAMAAELDALTWLDGRQARERAPVLRPRAARAALLELGAGDIDVARLHAGCLRMAREAGALVAAGLAEVAIERAGPVWRVKAGDETFLAPIVVNAAGAWADETAMAAGLAPKRLQPLRRTVVLADPPRQTDFPTWPIVKDVDERFYFRPFSGRLLITAADETPSQPSDAQPEALDIALAMQRFERAADHRLDRIRHRWAGLRTFAVDRAPVIGWSEEAEGFFWFAGLGGFGIQTSPATSALAAALLLRRPCPPELSDHGVEAAAYAPQRAALLAQGGSAGEDADVGRPRPS